MPEHGIFISHRSEDWALAGRIYDFLEARGYNPFLDAESAELRMNFVHDSIARNGIAAVFANADTTDLDTVTVSGCTINSSVAATAGVVAGVLNISGKVSEVNGIVVEGKNKVAIADTKSMTLNGTAKVNTSYIVGTAYAFSSPFGVANVKDAAFSEAGQVDHDLTVTNCSYGDKFAAGYWVKPLGGAKDVTLSETALKGYGYVFNSNANAGTSARYNHIGFMPKN